MSRRFQLDTDWQRDFGRMANALQECKEHTAAGHQLLAVGAETEAREQLKLADEAYERWELLGEKLIQYPR